MAYIGNSPANTGNYQLVDDIASGFNGSLVSFALASGGTAITPAKSGQILANINGVMQEPDDGGTNGFKVVSSNIVFSSAPASGDTFWAVYQGQNVDIGTPSDDVVDTAHIKDDAVTAAKLANSINTDIATGVTGNTTANAALPKAGGAMTGTITNLRSTGIDDNANALAVTIDASENVLVGKTSQDSSSSGCELLNNGTAQFTRDGNSALRINRLSSDGELLRLSKAGTTVGSIGVVNTNNPFISNDADNSGLQFGTNQILPHYDDLQRDNAVDLGSSSVRFKDLYLSGGLKVGGTGAANTLDDYEEGVHTVTATDSGGGATYGLNSSYDTFAYTKIGRLVTITGTLVCSAVSGTPSGTITLTLPYSCVNTTDQGGRSGGAGIAFYQVQKYTSGEYAQHNISEGANIVSLKYGSVGGNAYSTKFNTSSQLYCNFSYFTA